jgi:predicted Ser/Thr protein kinase
MTDHDRDIGLDATQPPPAPAPAHDATLAVGTTRGLADTAHTEAPVARTESTPFVVPAALANTVFAVATLVALANLAYYVARFLVAADPPELTRILRGATTTTAYASANMFDGPLLTIARNLLVATVFLVVPLWLSRRNRTPIARLLGAACMLAGQYSIAVSVLTSTETLHPWRELAAVIYVAMPAIAFATLAVYPNGRPVPRLAAKLLPIALGLYVLQAVTMYRTRGYSVAFAAAGLVLFCTYFAFQAWRYRRHATLREQHRIKWLTYGGGVFVTLQAVAIVGILPLLADSSRPTFPLLKVLYEVLLAAAYLLALATAMIGAARYRLWDIDRVINRTVVYALLSFVLAAVAAVVFFALDGVLHDSLAAVVAFAFVALAAVPARRRIAKWIDRRFYGIGVDYEALAAKAVRAAQLALPTTGTELGGYDELVLLGRGGMGAVYRAHHADFAVPVALKVMSPALASDADAQARFRREAEILETLRHPNVVPFLASGHERELAFIAMQYLEGEDLAAILRRKQRLALADIVPIVTAIAAALDVAHRRGIVHRDIKPANIFVEGTDRQPLAERVPRLVDFGVAQLPEDRDVELEADAIVGSLPYIAPEQIGAPNRVDHRADQYALAATIYELVTGRPPFRETTALGMVMAHLRQPPEDPRVFVAGLPPRVADALLRALDKDPAARFASAGELAAALRA